MKKEKEFRHYNCEVWENGVYVQGFLKWASSKKMAARFALSSARDHGNGLNGYLMVEVRKIRDDSLYSEYTIDNAGFNKGSRSVND